MIFLDFDGVICDFVGGFLNHLWFTQRLAFSYEDVTAYNMPAALACGDSIIKRQLDEAFQEFLHDKDALVNTCDPVRPIWNALLDRVAVGLAAESGSPKRELPFAICTTRTGIAREAAVAWCRLWGLSWVPIVRVPLEGRSKLSLLDVDDVLIEDNVAVAEERRNEAYCIDSKKWSTPRTGSVIMVKWPWTGYSRSLPWASIADFTPGTMTSYANVYCGTPVEIAAWLRGV